MLPNSPLPFSFAGLRAIFQRWKYLLGLAVGLAAVVSALVAWSLPNIYSSTAIFLPTSPQSTDPDRLVEGSKLEVGARSEDLDRVLTIGQSLPLAEQMIRRFNLYEHYQLGAPGTDAVENNVLAEYNSNLSIVHNERDAIELTFQDHDKKLAAAVANALVAAIDSANQQLTLENRRNVLEIYRQRSEQLGSAYERTRQRLLVARRRYGVFGLEQQGRYLGKAVIDTEKELRLARAVGLAMRRPCAARCAASPKRRAATSLTSKAGRRAPTRWACWRRASPICKRATSRRRAPSSRRKPRCAAGFRRFTWCKKPTRPPARASPSAPLSCWARFW